MDFPLHSPDTGKKNGTREIATSAQKFIKKGMASLKQRNPPVVEGDEPSKRKGNMDLLALLLIVVLVIGAFKLLGLVFKTAFFLISIPLQIIAAVVIGVVLMALLPVTLFSGFLAMILVPLGLLAPLLPVALIVIGIALLARR